MHCQIVILTYKVTGYFTGYIAGKISFNKMRKCV